MKVAAAVDGERAIKPNISKHPDDAFHKRYYDAAMKLLESQSETYGESLPVQIFPALPKELAALQDKRIMLIDKVGDTAAMLDEMGIYYTLQKEINQWSIPEVDICIIGRNSLDLHWEVTLMEYDNLIGRHFSRGDPTVIIFEQNKPEVFGLRTQRVQARYAFLRDPYHPILAGFSDEDFANWRGEADLLPPYSDDWKQTKWDTGVGYRYPSRHWPNYKVLGSDYRFPLWSNNGMVCTNAYLKPHAGPFRSLLDCGFDLLYTPLLEERRNNGRIIYCSLDVTNRYGKDPVISKLVRQMLVYAASPEQNRNNWRPLHIVPDTKLFSIASELELLAAPLPVKVSELKSEAVVIANASAASGTEYLRQNPAALAKFMEEGGDLVLFWAKPESDLSFLPFKLKVTPEARFATKDPEKTRRVACHRSGRSVL